MIQIDNKLISDDIVEKHFACALDKCKGDCCIAGELGAPLDEDELPIMEEIYAAVKPFLTTEGIASIEKQGTWVKDEDDEFSTPMIENGGPCAYTVFENGIALCGIERAYYAGAVKWKKPISCHLYPIRITKQKVYEALNYHRWDICKSACTNGKQKGIFIFEMVKEGLIRKYGKDFYDQLEATARYMNEQKEK